jgi:hypothetical protein
MQSLIEFIKHEDKVLNKGFVIFLGYKKPYEQNKRGLSYAYHKRIVCDDDIKTQPLLKMLERDTQKLN